MVEQQAGQALAAEFMPFQGNEENVELLQEKLEEYLIETQYRQDEGVREAMARAMRERRRSGM